jgi:hypothetical protein
VTSTKTIKKPQDEKPALVVEYSVDELDLVNQLIKAINTNNGVILVYEKLYSVKDFVSGYLKKEFPEIDEMLLSSFIANNSEKMILDEQTKLDTNFFWYEQFKSENLDENGKFDAYSVGRNKFQNFNGIIELSKVGFNADMSQALICIGVRKGPMNGYGDYLILQKSNNKWQVVRVVHAWIS